MKYENEVTVIVNESIDELKNKLRDSGFELKEEYSVNDIYFSKDNQLVTFDDYEKNNLLIREIVTDKKVIKKITHKYKEIDNDGKILKNGKLDCNINNIEEAYELLISIGYKERIRLKDKLTVYSNKEDELVIQEVNNKYLYIEIEEKCEYLNKTYNDIEEMKNVFNKYNIKIKENEYFAKKLLIALTDEYSIGEHLK